MARLPVYLRTPLAASCGWRDHVRPMTGGAHESDLGGCRTERESRSGTQRRCDVLAEPRNIQPFRTQSYFEPLRAHGRRRRMARLFPRFPARPRRLFGVSPRLRGADLSDREGPAARAQARHVQRDLGHRIDPAPRTRAGARAAVDRSQAGAGVSAPSFRTSAPRGIRNPEIGCVTWSPRFRIGAVARAGMTAIASGLALTPVCPRASSPRPRRARAAS